jgi:pteridine reductase
MPSPPDPRHGATGPVTSGARIALVIGGAGRIGAAVVEALSAHGWSVGIHAHRSLAAARDAVERLQGKGLAALAVTANLRDEGPVRALVHRVADHFGRIDALVTCASSIRSTPLDDLTADDFRAHYEVNCIGAFITAQEAGAVMTHQATGGAIVLVGAAESATPTPGLLAAAASLGSIPALTRGLAAEFAARNPRVRVNAVLPAPECPAERIARTVLTVIEQASGAGACLAIEAGDSVTPAMPPADRS